MRRALSLSVLAALLVSSLPADADPPTRWQTPPGDPGAPVVASQRPTFELLDDAGAALPSFLNAGGRFALGAQGERYRIRVTNPTDRRVEAVVSVDGLDAVDGRPATWSKRGYIVSPHTSVVVDGWRTSLDTVAAFRFAPVPHSYAAMTGHDANVGVIGVAFFREQPPPPPRPMVAHRAGPMPAPAATRGGADLSDGAGGAPAARPGLGTQFGESHDSRVQEVEFRRAEARPMTVTELRYDDRQGLLARGIRLAPEGERDVENERRDRAQPFADSRFAQPPR
jgi:hypothetical protein